MFCKKRKKVFTSQIISYPCPNGQLFGDGLYQTDKGKNKIKNEKRHIYIYTSTTITTTTTTVINKSHGS